MNFRELHLTRRQLLIGGATLATGLAAGIHQIGRHRSPSAERLPLDLDSTPPAEPQPEMLTENLKEARPYHLRYTEASEEHYANFIHSLGLQYIAPFEVIRAHRNQCQGVANSLPPEELWSGMGRTLLVADELRSRLGRKMLLITSAYRSPEYNRVIPGSAARSFHTKNCALDLVYDCSPKDAMAEARKMRKEGIFRGGLGLYSSFIHLDTRGSNAIWSCV